MDSQDARRSQRLRASMARRPPIEVITISSSSEDDDNEPQIVNQKVISTIRDAIQAVKKKRTRRDIQQQPSSSGGSSSYYEDELESDTTANSQPRSNKIDRANKRIPSSTSTTSFELAQSATSDLQPSPLQPGDGTEAQDTSHPQTGTPSPASDKLTSDDSFVSVHSSSVQGQPNDKARTPKTGSSPLRPLQPLLPESTQSRSSTTHPGPSYISPRASGSRSSTSRPSLEKSIVDQPPRVEPTNLDVESLLERVKRRKLALEKIVGAIKPKSDLVEFVIKWEGLNRLERMSLKELKILFPDKLIEFMCQRIKWRGITGSGRPRGRPPKKSVHA